MTARERSHLAAYGEHNFEIKHPKVYYHFNEEKRGTSKTRVFFAFPVVYVNSGYIIQRGVTAVGGCALLHGPALLNLRQSVPSRLPTKSLLAVISNDHIVT